MRKFLLRFGIIGLILLALLQGGYWIYRNHQDKVATQYLEQALEAINAHEFDKALEALKQMENISGISAVQKTTAKLLEQTLDLLKKAPDDQKLLDSMNSMIEESHLLQKEVLDRVKKTAKERYNSNLEAERDNLLQQLKDLDAQDTSKMNPAQMKEREKKRLEILKKLASINQKLEQQGLEVKAAPTPPSSTKERKLLDSLKNYQKEDSSKLSKKQKAALNAKKQGLIKALQQFQKSKEGKKDSNAKKKLALLNKIAKLTRDQNKTPSKKRKKTLQKSIDKAINDIEKLLPPSPKEEISSLEPSEKQALTENEKEEQKETPSPQSAPKSTAKEGEGTPSTQTPPPVPVPNPDDEKLKALEKDKKDLEEKNRLLQEEKDSEQKKQKINSLENDAKKAFSSGDYPKALDLYKQLEALNPNNPDYLGMQALSALRMSNFDLANQLSSRLSQKFPGDPMIPLIQAEIALAQKSPTSTQPYYEQAVEHKEISLALYRLGTLALRKGEAAKALTLYDRAMKSPDYDLLEDPFKVNLFHNQGEAFTFLSRNAEAKKSFENALRKNPQYIASYIALAQILYKEQNFSTSSLLLSQATKLDPKNFFALSLLGNTYHKLGNSDKAKDAFVKALEIQPTNASILYNLGSEEISLQDYPSAITHLEKSLSIKPNNKTNAQLGIALVRSGTDLPRAKQIFESILAKNPGDVDSEIGLIEISDVQGDYDTALSIAESVLQKTPNQQDILYKKASLLFKLKQYGPSVGTFQTLVKLNDSPDNILGLANALLANGDFSSALDQYNTLLEKKKTPEYFEGKANALIKLKKLAEAREVLQSIVTTYPTYRPLARVKQKLIWINRLSPPANPS